MAKAKMKTKPVTAKRPTKYKRKQGINLVGLMWHLENEPVDHKKLCNLLLSYIGNEGLTKLAETKVK